jgi:hypothetical protein
LTFRNYWNLRKRSEKKMTTENDSLEQRMNEAIDAGDLAKLDELIKEANAKERRAEVEPEETPKPEEAKTKTPPDEIKKPPEEESKPQPPKKASQIFAENFAEEEAKRKAKQTPRSNEPPKLAYPGEKPSRALMREHMAEVFGDNQPAPEETPTATAEELEARLAQLSTELRDIEAMDHTPDDIKEILRNLTNTEIRKTQQDLNRIRGPKTYIHGATGIFAEIFREEEAKRKKEAKK